MRVNSAWPVILNFCDFLKKVSIRADASELLEALTNSRKSRRSSFQFALMRVNSAGLQVMEAYFNRREFQFALMRVNSLRWDILSLVTKTTVSIRADASELLEV